MRYLKHLLAITLLCCIRAEAQTAVAQGGTSVVGGATGSSSGSSSPATSSASGTVTLATGQTSSTLAKVATTGAYGDLSGLPTLGTASQQAASYFDAAGTAATLANAAAAASCALAGCTMTGTLNFAQLHGSGTLPPIMDFPAGTGNAPALPANSAGFVAPVSGGTSYRYKFMPTVTAGLLWQAAPATIDGVNASLLSTATAAQVAALFQSLTNCNTANYPFIPQAGACAAPSGGSTGSGAIETHGYDGGTLLAITGGQTFCAAVEATSTQTSGHLTIYWQTTPNAANIDLGIYGGPAAPTPGALIAHIGAQVTGGAGGITYAWSGGTQTIPGGKNYVCGTGASGIGTTNFIAYENVFSLFPWASVSSPTTGGVLNSTITLPADNITRQTTAPMIIIW